MGLGVSGEGVAGRLGPWPSCFFGYEHWSAYDNIVDNYRVAWSVARMGQYFFNSLLISLCAVSLVMALGSMMAYGLTRLKFRGRGWIMGILVASMGIPGFLLVVPLFVMMKDWSLGSFNFMDSRTGLAVLYGALAIPFTTFLLSAFYRSLPGELAESAAIDGATPWQIFAGIVILCLPTFLIFVALQEKIVAGLTVGAVKE